MRKKYIIFSILFVLFILSNLYIPSNVKKIIKLPKDMILSISSIYNKPLINIKDSTKTRILEDNNTNIDMLQSENIELQKEINFLKEQLDLNKILSDKLVINATIISRNLNEWDKSLTIDKGSLSGIKDDMAVLYKGYLIGIIYNTSLYSSEVKLLSNNTLKKISVKIDIGSKEVYGILSRHQDKYKIEGITDMDEIPINSLVTTSGLNNYIPAGLKIGYVKDISYDNYDLAKFVSIEPSINFNELTYIMVVMKK